MKINIATLFSACGTDLLTILAISKNTPLTNSIADITAPAGTKISLLVTRSIPEHMIRKLDSILREQEQCMLYVHGSRKYQGSPHPVLCVLYAISEKEIAVSSKFRRSNFENTRAFEKFKDILYSDENKNRLLKYGLTILDDFDEYYRTNESIFQMKLQWPGSLREPGLSYV